MKSDWLFSITNICLLLSSCVNVNNFSYADLNYDKSITLVTKKSICSGLESTSFLELANKGNDCEYTNAMCLCKADDNNLFIVLNSNNLITFTKYDYVIGSFTNISNFEEKYDPKSFDADVYSHEDGFLFCLTSKDHDKQFYYVNSLFDDVIEISKPNTYSDDYFAFIDGVFYKGTFANSVKNKKNYNTKVCFGDNEYIKIFISFSKNVINENEINFPIDYLCGSQSIFTINHNVYVVSRLDGGTKQLFSPAKYFLSQLFVNIDTYTYGLKYISFACDGNCPIWVY